MSSPEVSGPFMWSRRRVSGTANNPFCGGIAKVKGAIDGALTFHITRRGWEIRSGNHRQMPNHEIYIYNGGHVTWVHKSKYASPLCLVGAATCDLRPAT